MAIGRSIDLNIVYSLFARHLLNAKETQAMEKAIQIVEENPGGMSKLRKDLERSCE